MKENPYISKAKSVIEICRGSGTNAEPLQLLGYEIDNLILMEVLAKCNGDESKFDELVQSLRRTVEEQLVSQFVAEYGLSNPTSSRVYPHIVEELLARERNGGRGAYEPRTVAGESKLIATAHALAELSPIPLNSHVLKEKIDTSFETVFENLIIALRANSKNNNN